MNDDAIHLDHEKLHVYRCAVEFLRLAFRIVAGLPRGEAELRSQLKRAAMSIPLNIAEVAPGKPGRRKHELRSKCESPRKDPAGNQPRAGRLVSTGKRVLRGLGATRAAKRRQRASGPYDPAPKAKEMERPTPSLGWKAIPAAPKAMARRLSRGP